MELNFGKKLYIYKLERKTSGTVFIRSILSDLCLMTSFEYPKGIFFKEKSFLIPFGQFNISK